jgi:L-asparaginase II
MTNPVLVEVTRGGIVESEHRGAVAVVDADGKAVLDIGDTLRPIFPRSAIKGLQAIPLIESGAAERFGLTDAEIALACASHNGETVHTALAASMLAKAGRDLTSLECGAHWPMRAGTQQELARQHGTPTALHNNCSGKHAGFICTACAMHEDPSGYVQHDHPVMRAATAAVEAMTDTRLAANAACGTDGCSIPAYALPLRALALGFARFGTGHGLGPARQRAVQRIREAVAAEPFSVAGTDRFDTRLMQAFRSRTFVKVGAEGVYCASFPELGFGVALKCDDGTTRAAEVMMAALVRKFLPLNEAEAKALAPLLHQPLTNWNGIHVGEVRPARNLGRELIKRGVFDGLQAR